MATFSLPDSTSAPTNTMLLVIFRCDSCSISALHDFAFRHTHSHTHTHNVHERRPNKTVHHKIRRFVTFPFRECPKSVNACCLVKGSACSLVLSLSPFLLFLPTWVTLQ